MKRLFWLGAGLAIGALVFRALSRRAASYTPRGLAAAARDSGRHLLDAVRDFADDVRDGMHERERELHAALLARSGADPGAGSGPGAGDGTGTHGDRSWTGAEDPTR
ncbi:MAG TPA: hypothetical protein VKY81_11680 [Natronosporangium sp.]|nr:hypothetical protein [Natronosporangium sp.]